jgi:hypothetical protein
MGTSKKENLNNWSIMVMSEERLERLEAIVESNARAIQAIMEHQTTDRLRHEERMASIERTHQEAMRSMEQILAKAVETQNGLAKMLVSLDEDRPIILQRLMKIEECDPF